MIKNTHDGRTNLAIPCCCNCRFYKKCKPSDIGESGKDDRWVCKHPRLKTDGKIAHLVVQPEDFCSRFEDSKK